MSTVQGSELRPIWETFCGNQGYQTTWTNTCRSSRSCWPFNKNKTCVYCLSAPVYRKIQVDRLWYNLSTPSRQIMVLLIWWPHLIYVIDVQTVSSPYVKRRNVGVLQIRMDYRMAITIFYTPRKSANYLRALIWDLVLLTTNKTIWLSPPFSFIECKSTTFKGYSTLIYNYNST